MSREQVNGIHGDIVMTIEKPLLASVDVAHQEALECLQKLLVYGGEDGQCSKCEFNEYCSGAFRHILTGSSDKN